MKWIFVGLVALAASFQPCFTRAAEKPVITVVLPSAESLYQDLKLPFDLVGDEKGYTTLVDTIRIFLVGVDPATPSGIRVYSTGAALPYILTLPVKNAEELKELLTNLWDLDFRTTPPPAAALGPQVPKAVESKRRTLKLTKDERLMFGLFEGYLRFEAAAGHVHISEQLQDVRNASGPLPVELLNGRDLVAIIDGSLQKPEERKSAFAKARKEVLGAVTKGEKEAEPEFALRKALAEQQIDEIERFFSESLRIELGWTTSTEEKNARMALDLSAVAGTALEASIEQLGLVPDEFVGVASEGAALKGTINFPLDAMRKANVTNIAKLARAQIAAKIDGDAKLSAEHKQVDKDLVDLIFDVVDDIAGSGLFNGFLRVWPNGNGTLTLTGGVKVPDGPNFVKILEKFATRGGGMKVDLKADSEGDVEIHKLTLGDLQKEYPELLDKDGVVYVGTAANAVWVGAGEKALERLKQGIQEAKKSGPQAGPVGELTAQLYPIIEVLDKIRTRQKPDQPAPAAAKKSAGETKAGEKKEVDHKEKAAGILADLNLRKLALEAFKEGKDTLSLSLVRDGKNVKLSLQLDEGIIRFVGKAASKFVKDNLGDD